MPTVEKAVNLDNSSSSSDDELPSLHDRFRKMLNPPSERPAASTASTSASTSRHVSSSSQATTVTPTLVPPKAPAVNSMFINQKHREHRILPARQHQPTTQYRQPKEIIEIDDSPPAKQQAPPKRFLSPARQPLTEVTSSSSGESIVQLDTNTNAKPSTSSFNSFIKPTSTPKKPSPDQYAHLPAKARIMASFQPQATGLANPIGRPRDPTQYASHTAYVPPNPYSMCLC